MGPPETAPSAPLLIRVSSADGRCTSVDPAWLGHTGRTLEQELGTGWLDGVHPDDRDACAAALGEAAAHGRPARAEYRLRRADGVHAWVVDRVTPLLGPDGEITGHVSACAVVEAHSEARAAQRARAELPGLLMQMPAAIWQLRGPDHVVELANPVAIASVGGREVMGRPIAEAVPELAGQGVLEMLDRLSARGEPFAAREARLMVAGEGGELEERFYSFVAQPTRSARGEVDGVLVHAFDVTEQVHARRAVEATTERTERVQRVSAALAPVLSERELGEVIVTEVIGALRARAGVFAVPRGDEGEVVLAVGYPDDALSAGHRFGLDDSIPLAMVLRTGESLWLEDADDWGRRFGPPQIGLGAAGACVPLVVGGQTVGALGFRFGQDERRFRPEERELMLTLAQLCAQALERARLYEAERASRRAAQRAEERSAFIATVGVTLDGALGHRQRMRRLARLLVPRLADVCILELADPSEPDRLVVAHRDRRRERRLHRLRTRRASLLAPGYGAPHVLDTGTPQLLPEIPAEAIQFAGEDGGDELVEELAGGSAMIVLLQARGRRLGTLSLFSTDPRRTYGPADLSLAEEIGRRAGLAVDNARLYENEQRAREAADRARERTAALQAVTARLSRARTPAEVAEAITGKGTAALAADACGIFLLSSDEAWLELLAGVGYPPDLASEHARIAAGAPGPAGEALRGEMVVAETAEEIRERWPRLAGAQERSGDAALICAPLVIDDRPVGVISLAFRSPRTLRQRDLDVVAALARLCAQALERARLYESEREVAAVLQRSLLPSALPQVAGVDLTVRYVASAQPGEVGGDWYEAVALPGGRIGLSVGDVVGRGPAAAAVMGQLRSGLRAFAMQGDGPAAVLGRLSRFAEQIPGADVATVAYAVLDPAAGELRYACAGHPPPLLVRPRDEAAYLWEGRGVPLAVTEGATYAEAVATLEPGAILVLYSDGLIERPDETLDGGFGRLIEAAVAASDQTGVDDFCRRLLDSVFPERGAIDDVALLAARLLSRPAEPLRLRFPARPEELSGMRRALTAWLDGVGAGPADRMDVSIAASEAATNAIEHAYPEGAEGTVEVAARGDPDGVLELSVRDRGRWRAIPAPGDRGRGLPLMRAVMDRVDLSTGSEGTTVTMRRRFGRP